MHILTGRIYLEGTVFPIGKLNDNRWGIPNDKKVIDSAIGSLKTSVVRVCASVTGEGEHHCDFSDDPESVIGSVVDSWLNKETNSIDARVEITNPKTIEMFTSGKLGKTWSPYGYFGSIGEDGFVKEYFDNRSLTFVNNPASPETYAKVVAGSKGVNTYIEMNFVGDDGVSPEPSSFSSDPEDGNTTAFGSSLPPSSSDKDFDNFGDKMPDDKDITQDEVPEDETRDSDLVEIKDMLGVEQAKVKELETKFAELSKVKPEEPKDEEEKPETPVVDAPDVKKLVEEAILSERERVEKEHSVKTYKELCDEVGIEVDKTALNDSMTSASINREIALIKQVSEKHGKSVGVGREPNYRIKQEKPAPKPEDFQEQSGWTLGKPDRDGNWTTK